jgi:hypothetical protein
MPPQRRVKSPEGGPRELSFYGSLPLSTNSAKQPRHKRVNTSLGFSVKEYRDLSFDDSATPNMDPNLAQHFPHIRQPEIITSSTYDITSSVVAPNQVSAPPKPSGCYLDFSDNSLENVKSVPQWSELASVVLSQDEQPATKSSTSRDAVPMTGDSRRGVS